ncbi:uncharacterized protein LOC129917806 [Episyrphus balteatus]|uniref:uncharacterized protein LOC129917806 n=1 Tax=Episyrphus balteatus TaxID=286459 RepID=UPI0024862AEC|nr:uncharacterized protein LOC129917806 [Episyrphus balteatus]
MDALDLIEKRIDTLNRVLGPIPDNDVKGSENFVDSLLSANTLLSSALAGRDNINKVLQRSDELERYLDPNFLEETQQTKAKEVYVNAVAPEIATTFKQLEEIKSLEKTLGAEYFRNIPDKTDELKELTKNNTEFKQQTEFIEESLILAMKRYGELQQGLVESLAAMNKRLDHIEEKLQKKKAADLNVDLEPPTE